jgi:5-carboxymethyl-2-hydroxymuconate isomerase
MAQAERIIRGAECLAEGAAWLSRAEPHFAPLLARRHLGLTLQIDEGTEVFDAKLGNLHPLFNKT